MTDKQEQDTAGAWAYRHNDGDAWEIGLEEPEICWEKMRVSRALHDVVTDRQREVEAEIAGMRAQVVLISQLAKDTNERNWVDKRLYIIQASNRALEILW